MLRRLIRSDNGAKIMVIPSIPDMPMTVIILGSRPLMVPRTTGERDCEF